LVQRAGWFDRARESSCLRLETQMKFVILYKAPLMDDWSVYMNYKADTLADAINYAAMLQRTDTKHKRQFKAEQIT
jgi:hypothetical protein